MMTCSCTTLSNISADKNDYLSPGDSEIDFSFLSFYFHRKKIQVKVTTLKITETTAKP